MNRLLRARIVALACVSLLGVVGCVSEPPEPVSREEKREIAATVMALDRETRMVSLRSAHIAVAAPLSLKPGCPAGGHPSIEDNDAVSISHRHH